jgi:hypothetical protein
MRVMIGSRALEWRLGIGIDPLIGLVKVGVLRSVSTAKTAELGAHAAKVSRKQGADFSVVDVDAGDGVG